MFKRSRFSCLLGTHRSLIKTFISYKRNNARSAYIHLSRLFCLVSRETEKQWEQDMPKSSNTCNKSYTVQHSNDTSPDRVNQWNSNCLLCKTQIHNDRRYAHTFTNSLKQSVEFQKTYHTNTDKSLEGNRLWAVDFNAGGSQHGPLVSRTCGVHKIIPQPTIPDDCLSAENKARCQVLLQPNDALYEKKTEKSWAAVLVSLCTVGGEPAFLFTLRSSKLRGKHKGDVRYVALGLEWYVLNW